ncbi:MAG: MFS transporter [Flavobacterium nitrogenifigens]|uniref:MFS transporter, PAT family, beta-lactamase induction signal transducer AmpG n=1 Tax=Flavobacterium nitrogenifigens TaxID=1617283 RepID=A0A521ACL8_9FLAO|nr:MULTISPECIES: MFS transporter [Flavobacterium]KAF2331432.1 AmpG family muropeptide MFS transporter [Flavobacterium nitrogenifigens]MDQ6531204.1 MFS transporter [Flavobacterium sp. LHD-85]MDQ8012640.1 MFS transporter [Flavobacterium nitrogenifigens]SMO32563.1 MFS transporter, PAT family, beta-lactamase induction signal transducer AmpG [Flavobacterium nitrogenifigens]
MKTDNKPWFWIPLLNFASGLPYAIIISVSVIMYKNLGISNEDIGVYTSLLYLPWVIKPLWSPLIELIGTKRKWFLLMQLIISIAFLLVGFTIPLNGFFIMTLSIFWVAAFASASNDIATDGFYLLVLPEDKQSFFIGIRSTFYRLSMLAGNGLVVLFAGYLEHKFGDNTKAWSYTMICVGLLMMFITAYNFIFTPKNEINVVESNKETSHQNFGTIFISFFKKKQIGLILAFVLVFRLGESQLLKMLSPFLLDSKELGGMGLDTEAVGIIYGTFGVAALTLGGILGGIAISRHGLTKWMFPMFLAMHLPIIGFILLAFFHPTSIYYIYIVVILEQFGYGFGFTAFMMYLIHVAEGESKTAHYALATGFMAMGMMLPGMLSGYIQQYLGYGNFFIWVLIATIPGLILSRFLTFPKDFGKKSEEV